MIHSPLSICLSSFSSLLEFSQPKSLSFTNLFHLLQSSQNPSKKNMAPLSCEIDYYFDHSGLVSCSAFLFMLLACNFFGCLINVCNPTLQVLTGDLVNLQKKDIPTKVALNVSNDGGVWVFDIHEDEILLGHWCLSSCDRIRMKA